MFGSSAAFSPDGRLAAMSAGDRVAAVWDVGEHRELCQLEHRDKVLALAFVAEQRLAVAAGRTVCVWDVIERRVLFRFPAFRKYADALAVSPDRRLLAAGSRDGTVRMWESATGREVANHNWGVSELRALAFAPDGTTAVAAGQSALVIWDLD
jgi:WD40 repeat protein